MKSAVECQIDCNRNGQFFKHMTRSKKYFIGLYTIIRYFSRGRVNFETIQYKIVVLNTYLLRLPQVRPPRPAAELFSGASLASECWSLKVSASLLSSQYLLAWLKALCFANCAQGCVSTCVRAIGTSLAAVYISQNHKKIYELLILAALAKFRIFAAQQLEFSALNLNIRRTHFLAYIFYILLLIPVLFFNKVKAFFAVTNF